MATEFTIGDKAVYPSQGVAEVIGIEKKEVYGKVQRFYVLRGIDTGLRILVPLDKADQVGLRRIAGREEIDEVMEILRDKEIHVDRQTWNRRYRGFMEKIKSGSLFEVAEVFRDLYRLKT
ncbi:MAG: CarD family transcriptional regulator, partial [Pseudomonadota bacterium]